MPERHHHCLHAPSPQLERGLRLEEIRQTGRPSLRSGPDTVRWVSLSRLDVFLFRRCTSSSSTSSSSSSSENTQRGMTSSAPFVMHIAPSRVSLETRWRSWFSAMALIPRFSIAPVLGETAGEKRPKESMTSKREVSHRGREVAIRSAMGHTKLQMNLSHAGAGIAMASDTHSRVTTLSCRVMPIPIGNPVGNEERK